MAIVGQRKPGEQEAFDARVLPMFCIHYQIHHSGLDSMQHYVNRETVETPWRRRSDQRVAKAEAEAQKIVDQLADSPTGVMCRLSQLARD